MIPFRFLRLALGKLQFLASRPCHSSEHLDTAGPSASEVIVFMALGFFFLLMAHSSCYAMLMLRVHGVRAAEVQQVQFSSPDEQDRNSMCFVVFNMAFPVFSEAVYLPHGDDSGALRACNGLGSSLVVGAI